MGVVSLDNFIRANQTGFGTASDGETWVHTRGLANWAISGNKGAVNTAALFNLYILGSKSIANQGIFTRVVPVDSANNGIIGRYNTITTYYYCVLNGGTTLTIGVAPSFSTIASAAFTYSNGTAYWVFFRLKGTTLSAMAWADGSYQPSTFTCSGTDATYASGGFGLGSDSASGSNTLFDAFSVTDLVPVVQVDGMGGVFG